MILFECMPTILYMYTSGVPLGPNTVLHMNWERSHSFAFVSAFPARERRGKFICTALQIQRKLKVLYVRQTNASEDFKTK